MEKKTKKVVLTTKNVDEVVKEEAKVQGGALTVLYPGGTRTYSKEVHGDNFADLAKEFAEKKGGTIA